MRIRKSALPRIAVTSTALLGMARVAAILATSGIGMSGKLLAQAHTQRADDAEEQKETPRFRDRRGHRGQCRVQVKMATGISNESQIGIRLVDRVLVPRTI